MEIKTLAMVWMLSGLFVAFLMQKADESKSKDYKGKYWFIKRSRSNKFWSVLTLIALAPISLLLGIVVMTDFGDE